MNGSSRGMQQIRRDAYAYKKISKHMQACKDDSMLNQHLGRQRYRLEYKLSCVVNEITKGHAN
jgi:hypothetical protein